MKTETVYIVHHVDTEGPLDEPPEEVVRRLNNIFSLNLDIDPTVENFEKLRNGLIPGIPADLKPEKSYSFSGGFEFQNVVDEIPIMIGLTGFITTLKDAFTEEFVSKTGNIERWERVNGSGAYVRGIEFDLGIRPLPCAEFRGGLTYKRSEYEEVLEDWNTRNFLRTPNFYGNIWMSLELSSNITFYSFVNYTGKADVPHEVVVEGQEDPLLILERSDSFLEIDFGLTICIPLITGVNSKFNVGIKNITNIYQKDLDIGPGRDPAYVYGPIRPRTMYVSFETVF